MLFLRIRLPMLMKKWWIVCWHRRILENEWRWSGSIWRATRTAMVFKATAAATCGSGRDWLIGAYNRNLPFDQFTIEQLAGDLLPDPTQDQIIATGFNRNHRLNGEGGRIVEEWFVETVIDRVETTGMTWMALTLNCARCHDHKYDPISQKEFYELFAFFNSNDESGVLGSGGKNGVNTPPILRVPDEAGKAKIAELDAAVAKAEAQMKKGERGSSSGTGQVGGGAAAAIAVAG